MTQQAVTLDTWEQVNEYLEAGWQYVDSKIIEVKKDERKYYFILQKGNEPLLVTINRSRK